MSGKILKKLSILILMPVLVAGIIFCAAGFKMRLKSGVFINGINLGGYTQSAAISAVRSEIEKELKEKALKIETAGGVYEFTYPEIGYKDNLQSLVNSIKKSGEYFAEVSYYLCGIDEICSGICLSERKEKCEPYAIFNPEGVPFNYYEGSDGIEPDGVKLKEDILSSLAGGFEPVRLKYDRVKRDLTISDVKRNTRVLSSFTTRFDENNTNRAHNIALAASKLNGSVIYGGQTLSFNDIVGVRSEERGFLPAKIIEKGKYTEGFGGGVCQVSTTLYNAALLAGCEIAEFHPHSLQVGYVPPSRDAMVSGGYCDLKIKNSGEYPLFIRAKAEGGAVTFTFYGRSDGAIYSLSSVVTGSVPYDEVEGEIIKEGKEGTLSEGYLTVTRGGQKTTKKIRTDKYLPIQPEVAENSEENEATPQS